MLETSWILAFRNNCAVGRNEKSRHFEKFRCSQTFHIFWRFKAHWVGHMAGYWMHFRAAKSAAWCSRNRCFYIEAEFQKREKIGVFSSFESNFSQWLLSFCWDFNSASESAPFALQNLLKSARKYWNVFFIWHPFEVDFWQFSRPLFLQSFLTFTDPTIAH